MDYRHNQGIGVILDWVPDVYKRQMHNNSNVLAFGARVIGVEMAKMITEEWLNAEYEGGRHQRRVDLVMDIERRNSGC